MLRLLFVKLLASVADCSCGTDRRRQRRIVRKWRPQSSARGSPRRAIGNPRSRARAARWQQGSSALERASSYQPRPSRIKPRLRPASTADGCTRHGNRGGRFREPRGRRRSVEVGVEQARLLFGSGTAPRSRCLLLERRRSGERRRSATPTGESGRSAATRSCTRTSAEAARADATAIYEPSRSSRRSDRSARGCAQGGRRLRAAHELSLRARCAAQEREGTRLQALQMVAHLKNASTHSPSRPGTEAFDELGGQSERAGKVDNRAGRRAGRRRLLHW